MKNQFFKLIMVSYLFILVSCGSTPVTTSNTAYKNIIGTTFKINDLEVAQYDFPKALNYDDAIKACNDLGEGWRLPNKDELNTLYQNRDKILVFSDNFYWSSTGGDLVGFVSVQDFKGGVQANYYKVSTFYVRAVRTLTLPIRAITIPTSNTDYENIIGVPIKGRNLEVAQHDFPNKMNYDDAIKACNDLGEGWRLPIKDELNTLYQNNGVIGSFRNSFYWSSTEVGVSRHTETGYDVVDAWYLNFLNGNQNNSNKNKAYYVRAVRSL